MRHRFLFAVTAVMASSLAVGVGIAVAVAPAAKKLTCHMSLTTTPPSGSNAVAQPAAQGAQYGPTHCGKSVGGGIASDSFTVPDTGDTVATFTQYFSAGTIKGTFDIAPQEEGPISVNSFSSQTWLGVIKITGGTGVYKGIKTTKKGVLSCSSPDSVHLSCVEKVKVTGGGL